MRKYIGDLGTHGASAWVKEDGVGTRPLNPRCDLRNHSPTGFRWGYGGSGPAQLALAICSDAVGDDQIALAVYQDFKAEVIAKLDADKPFELTLLSVLDFIARWPDKPETKH
jgi:hypothetical protein